MKAPEILGRRAAVVALCLGSMLLYIDFGANSVDSVAAKKETSPTSKHTRSTLDRWPMWGDGPGRNMVNRQAKKIPHTWDLESGKNARSVITY